MSISIKYPIKMTSNTTPPPFETNNYLVFDDNYSNYTRIYGTEYFTIKIDKKITLRKISIKWSGLNPVYSYNIYGIDDNENEILLKSIIVDHPTSNGETDILNILGGIGFDKFKIEITTKYNASNTTAAIYEIELYKDLPKLLLVNGKYCGLLDETFVSFTDINTMTESRLDIASINQKINNIEYPFKMIKIG